MIQSSYLPWKGYFDLIHDADLFVFYDDVQFTKNDWRNRNRIKTGQGVRWLTVPVGGRIHRRICDVRIEDHRWQAAHFKAIEQSYGQSPHFRRYAAFLRDLFLGRPWTSLSELNQHAVRTIAADFLGIRCEFADSRDFVLDASGSARLLQLLKKVGAGVYVSGPSARSYLDEAAFSAAGIEVRWKSYDGYPEYPQRHPPFAHQVSVLDMLVQLGPAAPGFIWGWRAWSASALAGQAG